MIKVSTESFMATYVSSLDDADTIINVATAVAMDSVNLRSVPLDKLSIARDSVSKMIGRANHVYVRPCTCVWPLTTWSTLCNFWRAFDST